MPGGAELAVATSGMRPSKHRARGEPETIAWLLVIPFGLVLVSAIVLLVPSIGPALLPPLDPTRVWTWKRSVVSPEPREQGAYLLALAAVAGLAGAVVATRTRPSGLPTGWQAVGAPFARVALVTLLLVCAIGQDRFRPVAPGAPPARYFVVATWVVAAVLAVGIALGIRSPALRRASGRVLRERSATRLLAPAVACLVTAGAMLASVSSDATIAQTSPGVLSILPYVLDEAFAVVNGLTPFVDFQPLYASFWPFVAALPLAGVARTLFVFTLTMSALSALALLAVYGILRRVTRSSVAALLLYVPFLATSLFLIGGDTVTPYSAGNYYPAFPLRYAGPYLLAWLTARQLARLHVRSHAPLFAVAGLVVLNNANFGVPALAGTLVALLLTSDPPWTATLRSLARDLAAGLAVAVAALCALTLLRAGALPDLTQLFDYASYFAGGYSLTRIPATLGLHVVIFVTYAAALVAAAARGRSSANRTLTGMLAWSGVFGLGAGSYYVAESQPLQLTLMFSAWALAMALLAVLVVERLAAPPRRRPNVAEAAVLVGIGLMACSLAQLPRPWSQIERLNVTQAGAPAPGFLSPDPSQRDFLASLAYGRHAFYVKRGAPVALIVYGGHRLADAFDVVDVNRYTDVYTLLGPSFLRRVVTDLRRAGGNTIVVPAASPASANVGAALDRWGFGVVTADGVVRAEADAQPLTGAVFGEPVVKWVDVHHLVPDALRGDRGRRVARLDQRD
jgi:hypothetical protein